MSDFKTNIRDQLKLYSAASFKLWPMEEANLQGSGDDEIEVLLDQFKILLISGSAA